MKRRSRCRYIEVIPNGIQSTIWQQSNHIVQRDFAVTMGRNVDDMVTVKLKGTQLLEKTDQQWDYKFAVTDTFG